MDVTEVVAPRSGPFPQAWALLREGLRGSRRDFTQGHVGHAIIVLAIPMVMEMSMESLFAVVDVFFVSKLGADAVATVGLTESMLAIVYSVAIGLCIGATAIVARRIGEKDREGAAVAAVQVLLVGLVVSAMMGIAGGLNARRLLAMMGASDAVLGDSARFTIIMLERQRGDRDDLPDQRDFPGSRGCCSRDARVVDRQWDQHAARSVADLRCRTISRARRRWARRSRPRLGGESPCAFSSRCCFRDAVASMSSDDI